MIPFGVTAAAASIKPRFMNASFLGAVGFGNKDEQPVLQNAIDFCISKNIPNLKINTGTYLLTSLAPKTGNLYHRDYLQVGYTPVQPNRANLTIIGNGTVILSGDRRFIPGSVGMISLLGLKENINNFKVDNITFKWDGNLVGDFGSNAAAGIWITNNLGGNFTVGYPINRNRIDISNNTFINCHRSINGASEYGHSTVIPGSGTDTVVISGNNFLYPKGSDSVSNAGGGQITDFGADTKNLIVVNNFAEGTSTVPVSSPNGLPKDGFTFGGGINNIVSNNTIARTWVESVIAYPVFYTLGITNTFTIPPVGQQLTFRLGNKTGEVDRILFPALTSVGSFGINNIIAHKLGDTWGGVYRIDQYTSDQTNLSVITTRLSGEEYGGMFANKETSPTGTSVNGGFLAPFALARQYKSYSHIHDNNFTPGLALLSAVGWGGRTKLAHGPAIRCDGGYQYSVSGNNIYFGGILAVSTPYEPFNYWVIEKNNFYTYNEIPSLPSPSDGTTGRTSISLNLSGGIVRDNNFTFWVNVTGGNANTVNTVNAANSPLTYRGIALHYGVFGPAVPSERQFFIDNRFYCTVPLSSSIINQTFNSTIYDVITGNQIINI